MLLSILIVLNITVTLLSLLFSFNVGDLSEKYFDKKHTFDKKREDRIIKKYLAIAKQ